jgi:hypothetical protein
LSAKLVATQLKLDEDDSVPSGTIVVPNLAGPNAADSPFFTTTEPMIFHAKGDGSTSRDVRLMVQVNQGWPSAVVAPVTRQKLANKLGVEIEARRLTWLERVRGLGKAEVLLAVIALLLAASAILTTIVTPSADHKAGRADLATQLQPIEQRLAAGIRTHDPAAVQQAQTQLRAALKAETHASNDVSSAAVGATLVLGLLSAMIACGVAAKRATTTP